MILKNQNILKIIANSRTKPESYWREEGEKVTLKLFHEMSQRVPAYRSFLIKHKIKASDIKNIKDLKKLPITSKENYLRPYLYIDLFPNREVHLATTISATSGSTGEPFYFPRNELHDDQYLLQTEIFLKEQFEIEKKKTLAIMGFGLGIWIGGIFTYKILNKISQKGHNLTVVPTGTNKDHFLRAVKKFGRFYDQIILMGYPPFIKDVLDGESEYGICWRDYKIRVVTATEGFSEKFRDYISRKAGLKNPLLDIVNIYGTVELGTMAHETALSNLIRRLAVENKNVFKTIFPKATNIPTLAQYYPPLVYFEEFDGEVIASGYGSCIPLIRYRFNDLGGVISFDEMMSKLKSRGLDPLREMKKRGLHRKYFRLPFVYIYARSDFAVVFRGANIYPQEIQNALDDDELSNITTGRFTMIRKEDRTLNQILEINVELKKNTRPSKKISEKIRDKIVEELLKNNSEYKNNYNNDKKSNLPKILLWPHQHKKYFARLGKQSWVKKS